MTRRSTTPRRALSALLVSSAMLLGSAVVTAPALAAPPEQPAPGSPPTLTPRDGAYLEGVETVTAEPTTADDDVTSLTVDGQPLEAETTYGEAELSFDVGSNSTEARYGSYLLVNGEHRLDIGDHVDERVSYDVPTTWLTEGENVVEVKVGAVDSACGSNYDDYDLSDVRLDLLGESANGEDNEWSYAFGDGSCGTNTGRVTSASLSFFILEDPTRTTGLTAELDTASLSNGRHDITATSASGASVTHTVEVNNAPAGAPRITPQDGVVVRGTQPVFAHQAADASTGVDTLTVDGGRGARPSDPGVRRRRVHLPRRQQLDRGALQQLPARERPARGPRRRLRRRDRRGRRAERVVDARGQHAPVRDRDLHDQLRRQPRRLRHLGGRAPARRRHRLRAGTAVVVRPG